MWSEAGSKRSARIRERVSKTLFFLRIPLNNIERIQEPIYASGIVLRSSYMNFTRMLSVRKKMCKNKILYLREWSSQLLRLSRISDTIDTVALQIRSTNLLEICRTQLEANWIKDVEFPGTVEPCDHVEEGTEPGDHRPHGVGLVLKPPSHVSLMFMGSERNRE